MWFQKGGQPWPNPPATLAIPEHQLDWEDVEPWATKPFWAISVAHGNRHATVRQIGQGPGCRSAHAPAIGRELVVRTSSGELLAIAVVGRPSVPSRPASGRRRDRSAAPVKCVQGPPTGTTPGSRYRRRGIPGRVKSCDNGSSGACEVRAATSLPRSGGSGLYAPPRGHDQGRARGRLPRGAPVPLARLEG
jgi:hypothetical protein